jgi:RHS repeat-associated protein
VAGEGGALVVFDSGLGRGGRYNGSVLQQQQNQEAYRSAARRRGAEKPRLGVSGRNPASHRGFARCKSQTALGLPAVEPKTRVRSFCSGEQYDPDLGLYYLRARYYNPNTGRFLSRDPEDGDPFDPKTLHKYLYAGGDPVNAIDPTGKVAMIQAVWNYVKSFVMTNFVANPVRIFIASCLTAVTTAVIWDAAQSSHPHPVRTVVEIALGNWGCSLIWTFAK